jgi:hypothetical protein
MDLGQASLFNLNPLILIKTLHISHDIDTCINTKLKLGAGKENQLPHYVASR